MDKFTKTTEIDISDMNTVEDDAPQKSRVGKIIAIVISLLIAVSIWLYVKETDVTLVEKEFSNIEVVIINAPENYSVTANNVSITLVGTNSQLIDVDPSEIKIVVDASSIDKVGKYEFLPDITIVGNSGVELKDKAVMVTLVSKERK